MVIVYTQVYNALPYLEQCLKSVLSQTYPNFKYLILDNGSTDGSQQLLEQFAASDSRITLKRFEQNIRRLRFYEAFDVTDETGYFTMLDADDWWEKDYLEKLLLFAGRYKLGIACTGTLMHAVSNGHIDRRESNSLLLVQHAEFAKAYAQYHVFFRTIWGKLIRLDYINKLRTFSIPSLYGMDTIYMFQLLRQADCIGIDTSVLHHYRIYGSSDSYKYEPQRFEADVYLYNDAVDFLASFGPISAQNRRFLQGVYANALVDTTGVIQNSTLSPAEKLREYRTIAEYPLTAAVYLECKDEDANRSKLSLLLRALEAGANSGKQDNIDFRTTMQALLPQCGQAVSTANVQMFLADSKLLQSLLRDDPEAVLQHLLERMEKNQGVKKYSIPETIQNLAVNKPLLCQIGDAVFLRKYHGIYRKVWKGEHIDALDEMTGLLLKNKVTGGQETFLQLYLSLAATENQVSAFIFGKLQLVKLYLRQNRKEDCCVVVNELIEMGVDNEELTAICAELGI